MKIVRVQYTVRPEFVPVNKENIRQIVNELRSINNPRIKYSAYLLPDGKTFMHFDHFDNEEAHQVLQSLESFKKFAHELSDSNSEVEPKLELLKIVASTEDFFVSLGS